MRNYKVEVEVVSDQPLSSDQASAIDQAVKGFGIEVTDVEGGLVEGDNHYLLLSGTTTLGGGMDEHEAHYQLTEVLAKYDPFTERQLEVKTRWLCLDDVEWDEEFGDWVGNS